MLGRGGRSLPGRVPALAALYARPASCSHGYKLALILSRAGWEGRPRPSTELVRRRCNSTLGLSSGYITARIYLSLLGMNS